MNEMSTYLDKRMNEAVYQNYRYHESLWQKFG